MNTPLIFTRENMRILHMEFQENDPIYVQDLGWHKNPPNHSYGPAMRDYYLLHLVKSGMGYVERNGIPVIVQANEAFLIRPDEITTYYADENDPWEYYWIAFNGPFAEKLLLQTTDKLFIRRCQKSGLLALQDAIENNNLNTVDALSTLFTVLQSIRTNKTNYVKSDGIQTALRFFENNYFQETDIGLLAESLGYSRAYFSTLFFKRMGESPYRYLTKLRIEKAKTFLRETDLSIEEIAFSVGFSCVGRFSEQFKKQTELSPLQYRKSFDNLL